MVIDAQGVRHEIVFGVDVLRQQPAIDYATEPGLVRTGTSVTIEWPDSACSILTEAKARFLQIADDFTWLNPHLSLTVDWFGERVIEVEASDPSWRKWKPSDPTCPHWYTEERLERLIGAYLAHDQDNGHERTVREFIAEFAGLSATAKQKAVLDAVGLSRTKLSALYDGARLDSGMIRRLLGAMKAQTKVGEAAGAGDHRQGPSRRPVRGDRLRDGELPIQAGARHRRRPAVRGRDRLRLVSRQRRRAASSPASTGLQGS